jgi:sugar phosphate permease
MCLTFKEPILALMLGAKNLSVTEIGLVFSIDTITYTLTSMALNFVKEERNGMKYGLIQFAGLLFFGLCMIMQGPAPFLPE